MRSIPVTPGIGCYAIFFAVWSSLAFAQVSCADWNTSRFFENATAEDVVGCIASGANVSDRDGYEETPLHNAAALTKSPALVTSLLDAGAELEARDKFGQTPLHHAAAINTVPAVVTALLNFGADLEARDEFGRTPLHQAAESSISPAVVKVLLDAGADLKARDDMGGQTPLDKAASSNQMSAVLARYSTLGRTWRRGMKADGHHSTRSQASATHPRRSQCYWMPEQTWKRGMTMDGHRSTRQHATVFLQK